MVARTTMTEIKEAEESDADKKKTSAESSIFSTILADIEQSPTILQKQKNLSAEFSIFSPIFADIDEENPTILQKKNKKLKKTRRRGSIKTPIDFTCTVPQTLTRSDLVDKLNQEVKILKSEMETKGQTSDRSVSRNPNFDRECDRVKEGKVEQREEVKFLAKEVSEQISKGELKSDISTDDAEDSVCKLEDADSLEHFDDMLSTMLGDENEQVNIGGGGIDEFMEEMFEKTEKDGSYLERIKDNCVFGGLLEGLLREKLREKAEKEEMLPTMVGDENEQVNNAEGGGGIDEFIEELFEKIEKDGSYLDRIKDNYEYGDLLDDLLRNKLREKAEKEEKEISSWITNGEPEVEIGVAEEKKEERRNTKKESPVKVKLERSEQESTVTKRSYIGYKRRLYLIERLRERDENLRKRRGKAVRLGVEFSFLVAEYMFLIPNELLASEIEDYWICLKRFGVNEDDKGTSVIIGKLEEVFEIVIRKKQNKEHHNVNLPESDFRFDDYIPLCAAAIQVLGKIVWALRRNQSERLKLSDLDSLFKDFHRVLMKIELKLAEMKQGIYRSVSVDYESFAKSERFDSFLRRKLMKRFNADNRFGRSAIVYYLAQIWKPLFLAKALQEQVKEQ